MSACAVIVHTAARDGSGRCVVTRTSTVWFEVTLKLTIFALMAGFAPCRALQINHVPPKTESADAKTIHAHRGVRLAG